MPTASSEEIQFGSTDYHEVLVWRDRILRRPLGLALSPNDTAGEDKQRHFVLREADSILAGVIAVEVNHRTFRLRQMWVRDSAAGSGLGQTLMEDVERILKSVGCREFTLHARLNVRGFYEKCGYFAEGEIFEEIGIPHIVMTRRVTLD